MSTHPDAAQGWTAEDLKAFGVEAEAPASKEEPKAAEPNNDDIARLALQAQQESQRQSALLQNELIRQRTYTPPAPPPPAAKTLPDKLPVMTDGDGNLWVKTEDVVGASKSVVDEYHKNVIEPAAPILERTERQQNLQATMNWLKKEAPDVSEGDLEQKAALAMGLYNSQLNPGHDDLSKSAYVIEQLRTMKLEPGNPTIKPAQPQNQVGRTAPGGQVTHPYASGSKINIPRTTSSEMGFEAYMASIDQERQLREYNDAHKMGWTFNVIRPR